MPKEHENKPEPQQNLKAGAIICPICCVELIEVEVDFDFEGLILRNIKVLKCPICQEERFTMEQQKELEKQLRNQEENHSEMT